MKDRVLVGFISGILAAIGADIVNWLLYYLNYADRKFLDWAAVIFFGHLPTNVLEVVVMQIAQIVWDGLMGIVFILILPTIKSHGIVLKGIIYAISLMFLFRATTVLFDVPYLKSLSIGTFLSNALCSIVWGVLIALIIKRFSVSTYQ
ncbi:MAG TPA: hypothetical protein GXZ75_09755 [Clostridia bacterium]|nr:hypothetical protein [Clostridia bacterium]